MLLYLFFHVFFFNYFYKQLCATCVLFNKIKWNVKKTNVTESTAWFKNQIYLLFKDVN
jgi:hypothetical protein